MGRKIKEIWNKILQADKFINEYKNLTHTVEMPASAYVNWGVYMANKGEFAEAVEKFNTAAMMVQQNPKAYVNLGIVNMQQKDYSEAVKNFRKAVKAVKKDMLIIGEIWHYAGDFLEGDEWDTVMNYPFYLNMIDLLADEKITVSQFIQNLGYLKGRLNKKCYPLMWNLIDSHDTARFLHLCNDNKKKQHLAAAFQLLLPGMPMIYYGDEFAMPGANDPDCRRGMYWDEEYQDKEMFEWYKQLLKVRKNHACIVEGEPMEIAARDEEETIVLTRKNGEETLALIFNCSSSARMFNEYAQKYDLLRENPFDGKIEGLDAAVIVL